jgi:ABC-type nickel/cobalt efflux system permease component RcnA
MRPGTGTRFITTLLLFASLGLLAWLASNAKISYGLAITLGIVGTIAVVAWNTATDVCPRCGRALYTNRARCRVCGFDLWRT